MKLTPHKGALNKVARFVWLDLPYHSVHVHTPKSDDGTHQRVVLTISSKIGRGTVGMDLSALTSQELEAFRQAILIATEASKPVVETLDQKAMNDEQAGDDSNTRLYRGLPRLVIRPGTLGPHDPSLLLGRSDILRGLGAIVSATERSGSGGPEVADEVTEPGSTSDDPPTGS